MYKKREEIPLVDLIKYKIHNFVEYVKITWKRRTETMKTFQEIKCWLNLEGSLVTINKLLGRL